VRGREGWEIGRQLAESNVRQLLVERGIDIPRQCPTCGEALEALLDGTIGVIARCTGTCGRKDERKAYQHLRASGAPILPGFDGL
jgi:hypothetical protein